MAKGGDFTVYDDGTVVGPKTYIEQVDLEGDILPKAKALLEQPNTAQFSAHSLVCQCLQQDYAEWKKARTA